MAQRQSAKCYPELPQPLPNCGRERLTQRPTLPVKTSALQCFIMPISSADEPRRVIAPTFPYVPDGIYADPHVQAWADYYASGGRDLAGTTYFNTPIPGLTDIEQTVEPETVVSDRARTPSTSSGLSRRPTLPPASPPQTRNTSAETVPIRTRKLSRAKSTRKNILGLLETLHLRRRKDSAPDFEIDGNASPTVRRTTSVRFQDDEVGGSKPVSSLILTLSKAAHSFHPLRGTRVRLGRTSPIIRPTSVITHSLYRILQLALSTRTTFQTVIQKISFLLRLTYSLYENVSYILI